MRLVGRSRGALRLCVAARHKGEVELCVVCVNGCVWRLSDAIRDDTCVSVGNMWLVTSGVWTVTERLRESGHRTQDTVGEAI